MASCLLPRFAFLKPSVRQMSSVRHKRYKKPPKKTDGGVGALLGIPSTLDAPYNPGSIFSGLPYGAIAAGLSGKIAWDMLNRVTEL